MHAWLVCTSSVMQGGMQAAVVTSTSVPPGQPASSSGASSVDGDAKGVTISEIEPAQMPGSSSEGGCG